MREPHDLVSRDADTLRYWHEKQMRDPVKRVAELETMIRQWVQWRCGWPLSEPYVEACEILEREGMRLWRLSHLPPNE